MMKLRLRLWLFVLWLNVKTSLQQNDPTCEFGIIHSNLFVAGLPPQNQPITAGHKLRFLCSDEYKLKGSKEIECLQTGRWNSPFPTCSDPTCEVGVMDPRLFVSGLPLLNQPIQPGHKLRFQCNEESELRGSREIECLRTGQWNSPVPTCSEYCKKLQDDKITLNPTQPKERFADGDTLHYRCKADTKEGTATCTNGRWFKTVECQEYCGILQEDKITLEPTQPKERYADGDTLDYRCKAGTKEGTATCTNGRWFKTVECQALGCSNLTFLDNGDYLASKTEFAHNERVEYRCQRYHRMEGQSYKTCKNGIWTGETRSKSTSPFEIKPNSDFYGTNFIVYALMIKNVCINSNNYSHSF